MPDEVRDQEQNGGAGKVETTDDKPINPDDHKRAVSDMLKYKGQVRELSGQLDELSKKLESVETQKLEEQNNYKSLYEQSVEKLNSLEQDRARLKDSVMFNAKLQQTIPALKKAGFRDDAIKQITPDLLSDVEVEVTSEGRFLVHGSELIVDKLKADHPYYFSDTKLPNVNTGDHVSGSGRAAEITPKKLYEMSQDVKRGKVSREEYHEAYKKYLEQKRSQ